MDPFRLPWQPCNRKRGRARHCARHPSMASAPRRVAGTPPRRRHPAASPAPRSLCAGAVRRASYAAMAAAKQKSKAPVRRKTTARRGRLAPSKGPRGLEAREVAIAMDSADIAGVVALVAEIGGAALGAYRDPLGGRPLVLASIPLAAVQPTPFQRDLSPTHTKRLAQKIDEAAAFLDPLIVVRGEDGKLWTPNGRHRLAAAKVLGLKQITVLISPDESLAYRILALNTEKAHNLRDRSLEVIRMARSLARTHARSPEVQFTAEFESA